MSARGKRYTKGVMNRPASASTTVVAFDAFTLAAVASELNRLLTGARVQKVQQPTPHELVLSLYGKTGAHRLLVSSDPQTFRAHLTQVKRDNPQTPPGFCQVCRKYLEGAYFEGATLLRLDRLARLTFLGPDRTPLTLVLELMGRNANVVLTSGAGTAEVVRGAMRVSPSEVRPLRPNLAYVYPPGYKDRRDPLTVTDASDPIFADAPSPTDTDTMTVWLGATFSGLGKFGAQELTVRAGVAGSVGAAVASLMDDTRNERFAPHSIGSVNGGTVGVWAFAPLTAPAGLRFLRESVSVALDTFYATREERAEETGERAHLAKALAKETAFRERELASARATLAEAGRADEYERQGNILLAQLHAVPRGAATVTLPDPYSEANGDITITLDPKRTPHENAESFFDRSRKVRDAKEYADGRAADLEDELEELRALAHALQNAQNDAALSNIRVQLEDIAGAARVGGGAGAAKPAAKQAKPFDGHRIRTYALDGFTLLVGETAEANDHLMTRVASPSDYWMHVRAGTGAHGVLRTNGKPERVPDAILRRAAAIVAAKSGSVKHSGVVAVDLTEKRHVRKPRGGKPGLAMYTTARTLDVRPELP